MILRKKSLPWIIWIGPKCSIALKETGREGFEKGGSNVTTETKVE